MSAEEKVAELRREIEAMEAVAALEAQLLALKADPARDADEYNRVKHALRATRKAQREQTNVVGTVSPDVIEATATVEED